MAQSLRTRKPTVSGLIWVVFSAAIVLTLMRGFNSEYRLLVAIIVGYALLILAHWFWFEFVPMRIIHPLTLGDFDRERIWLERVLMVPSLLGELFKALPRSMLMVRYQVDRHGSRRSPSGLKAESFSVNPAASMLGL